jgi:MoxR-like ATPase
MASSVRELNALVRSEAGFVKDIYRETRRIIVGQERLIKRMLIALLSDGHLLIEGVPGLAKTLAVRTLASTINADFQRLQFTPDLLPSDLIGTQIYLPASNSFMPKQGPIFSNIVLADEINRAPAKVQSALLEAMEERQVTLGETTFALDDPFLVLATQNPIEQEGTYPLPEAQLDRFMMKVVIQYPTRQQERDIIERMAGTPPAPPNAVIERERIHQARDVVKQIYVDEKIKEYALDIIFATRQPQDFDLSELNNLLTVGASPRATLWMVKAAKANAFIDGRGYVKPDDVKSVASDILRHRLVTSFEAKAEGISAEQIISRILGRIDVP